MAVLKGELVELTAENKRLRAQLSIAGERRVMALERARVNAVRVVELETEKAALQGRIAELEAALKAAEGVHA